MTAETLPAATRAATASWPALGLRPVQPARPANVRLQASWRLASSPTNSWNRIGLMRLQTPPGLRKSGMPDSVEMPAPVNTTTRRARATMAARSARLARMGTADVIGAIVLALPRPSHREKSEGGGAMASDEPWWKRAVFYQVYPRSFFDADGDGVGDLAGIAAKLDHIAALGVDAIWLAPVFTSPMKDFGYDISDYRGIDPLFGTLADFDALVAGAHERGLKLIVDQVWSHTSDQHPWFMESASSRDNPKADWYVWVDAKADGTAPNNWMAVFGGPSWRWSPRRRQYYLHNFLIEQPDLNFWNPEVRAAILDVARFWLDRGVDGFRLDVINMLFHDRTLADNPSVGLTRPPVQATDYQLHVHDRSREADARI